jgi:DNA-binding protein HU-beta
MTETKIVEIMGKQELVKRIAKQLDLSQKQTSARVDATLRVIKEVLQAGEEIRLVGFGTFAVRRVAARAAVNPRMRESMTIPVVQEWVRVPPGKKTRRSGAEDRNR